jgi:hypothetical protein
MSYNPYIGVENLIERGPIDPDYIKKLRMRDAANTKYFSELKNIISYVNAARKEYDFLFKILKDCEFVLSGSNIANSVYKNYHNKGKNGFLLDPMRTDIDIYAIGETEYNKIQSMSGLSFYDNDKEDHYDPGVEHVRGRVNGRNLDLINGCSNLQLLVNSFDFFHCSIFLGRDKFYFLNGFFKSLIQKKLVINRVHSVARLFKRISKYSNRGFTIDKIQSKKIELIISKHLKDDFLYDPKDYKSDDNFENVVIYPITGIVKSKTRPPCTVYWSDYKDDFSGNKEKEKQLNKSLLMIDLLGDI